MPKYPYYGVIPVSPEAQAYIARQCENLDIHPTYIYALAQKAMDEIGETSREKTEQVAVAYAAVVRKELSAGDDDVRKMQATIAYYEANCRLQKLVSQPHWVANNLQTALEELSIIEDLLNVCNPLYGAKL